MKKALIIAVATTLALGATPSLAKSFSAQDADGNGQISRDEFYSSAADNGTFSDWDTTNDGLIDENEFGALDRDWSFADWDTDGNDYLDSGEFYDGYYASYDANEDGHWDNGEWDDAGENGLFDF
ncbi:penta-EF hand family protein [Pararhizobium mangrovi]|uniref:EF-hand domain-containing protein n=1 Tax=Pararhizobium mangrovi TaxID=2590452 RepID=A0A506U4N4_9HYPH|nr:hypothetical protein [Pararhizobium mangrovi]TPW29322.1 hypothetical protein FJU11_07895 [Pararhizobium mangrovi]